MIQLDQTTIELQSIDASTRLVLTTATPTPMVAHLGGLEDGFVDGDVIEVISKGPASFTFMPKPGSTVTSTTETFGGSLVLLPNASARLLFESGAWEIEHLPAGGFLFQVGSIEPASHYHYAVLSMAQAQALVQGTDPLVPVADPSQPSAVITAAANLAHSHDVTVFFDYTNHTFIATDVTSNHAVPHVAFVVGDGPGSLTLGQLADVDDFAYAPNNGDVLTYNSGSQMWEAVAPAAVVAALNDLTDVDFGPYPPDNGEVLTFNSTLGSWEPQAPQAQPYDLKGRPMETVALAGTAETIGSARHHNTHFRTSAATAVVITIPADSSWPGFDQWYENGGFPMNPGPMPTGGSMIIGKHGAGNVTFAPAPGVTINTPDTLTISSLHGKATLIKVGPDVWDLEGNIGA